MATRRKHQPRSRRKSGRLFHIYIVLSTLLIIAAVVAGSMVFFKANKFEVQGNQRYTEEELLEVSGLEAGENLFRIPRREIARQMEEALPYLKRVNIRLIPPERVVIEVEETVPAGAIVSGSQIWYVDSGGKLLEQVSENGGYPEIIGLTLVEPAVGTEFAVAEEDSLKAKGLKGLLAALEEKNMLSKVQSIDLSASSSYLVMLYENRLSVKMGLADDFVYDLKMLTAAEEKYISENWGPNDTGTLDMTRAEGQAHLSRDD